MSGGLWARLSGPSRPACEPALDWHPWIVRATALLLVVGGPAQVSSHEFSITPVTVVIAGDGTFRADVGLDADALALGMPLEADSEQVAVAMRELSEEELAAAIETARQAVRADIRVALDGRDVPVTVSFPLHGTAAAEASEVPTVLGALARLDGLVPAGADLLTVRLPVRYKAVSLEIVVPGRQQPYASAMQAGQASPPFSLSGSTALNPPASVFRAYLGLGFTHIVPKGLDHILFVLGLYLLSPRWRHLLLQVSAFTLAHSVTLGLSMQGIFSLPERLVETLIALSISWVAIENIATSELKPWRLAAVFGFGLLHGLGFAGVLADLGMPEGRFLTALLAFNLGVEAGQLAVVAVAFGITVRFRHLSGYRRWFVIPCCAAIGATGAWWAVTRFLA